MTPQSRHTWITSLLFLGLALVLFYAGSLLQERTSFLKYKNKHHQSLLKRLKTVQFPEQFISLLEGKIYKNNEEEFLSKRAKTHYISLKDFNTSLDQEGLPNIEMTFSAELDTDVFHYIQDLKDHHKNTLAFKEVGLFRNETGVTGKMIFKVFKAHNEEIGSKNE